MYTHSDSPGINGIKKGERRIQWTHGRDPGQYAFFRLEVNARKPSLIYHYPSTVLQMKLVNCGQVCKAAHSWSYDNE